MKSGRNPDEFTLHSLRIGGATKLAAGEDASKRATQKYERWKPDAYKTYTCNNAEESRRVSRKLAVASEGS